MTTGPWGSFLLPANSSNACIAILLIVSFLSSVALVVAVGDNLYNHHGARGLGEACCFYSTVFWSPTAPNLKSLPAGPGVPNWSPIQVLPRPNDS